MFCLVLVRDCVIFKAPDLDIAVSLSDLKDLSFCPISEFGCKHLLLLLVQLPSPCLLLGNRRKVKIHFVLPVLCRALLLLTSGKLVGVHTLY